MSQRSEYLTTVHSNCPFTYQNMLQDWPISYIGIHYEPEAGQSQADVQGKATNQDCDLYIRVFPGLRRRRRSPGSLRPQLGGKSCLKYVLLPDALPATLDAEAEYFMRHPQADSQYQCDSCSHIYVSLQIPKIPSNTLALSPISFEVTPAVFNVYGSQQSSEFLLAEMSEAEQLQYPISPPSEGHQSIISNQPRAVNMSNERLSPKWPTHGLRHSIDASASNETPSPRTSCDRASPSTLRRDREPPRNDDDRIYCDYPACIDKKETFLRVCEWNKHMDKHERPYKCLERGCERLLGFTYSGGLSRHQREVHKKQGITRSPLYCPFPTCNRGVKSGHGFTRQENLNEHRRRRHSDESLPGSPASSIQILPSPQLAMQSRKRKRPSESSREHYTDSEGSTEDETEQTPSLRTIATQNAAWQAQVITRLTEELRQKSEQLAAQATDIQLMRATIRSLELQLETKA